MTNNKTNPTDIREAFEASFAKFKEEWSDADCPLLPEEEDAYKAGFEDAERISLAELRYFKNEHRRIRKLLNIDGVSGSFHLSDHVKNFINHKPAIVYDEGEK